MSKEGLGEDWGALVLGGVGDVRGLMLGPAGWGDTGDKEGGGELREHQSGELGELG